MVYKQILINTEELKEIVNRLAARINQAYNKDEQVVALVLLEGAKYFAQDLLKKVTLPVQVEFLKASSYRGGTASTGQVQIQNPDHIKDTIKGKQVLLIDDIYDTGLTLSCVLKLLAEYHPESIRTCVLLEKQIEHTRTVEIDFLGTEIADEFVIGYGLDYNHQYRELPFIAVLSPEYIDK